MEITFESIVGKVILVGYTRCMPNGEVLDRSQRWGRVTEADERRIVIQTSEGKFFMLPPELDAIRIAPPGTYRLHSTGEEIENPDLLSNWIIDLEGEV